MSAETIPNEAMAWEYETQIFDGSWHSVVTREHPDILGNTYRNLQPLFTDRSTRPAEPAAPVAEAVDGDVIFRFPTIDQALKEMLDVATSQEEGAGGDFEDWDVDHRSQIDIWQAGLAEGLEAERARADELRLLLTASGRCVDDLTARLDASEHAEEVARDAGFNHALTILEDALGSPTYYAANGSETWEGDTRGTIYNLLRASGVWSGDDDMLVTRDRDFWKERFQVESRARIEAEQRAADALARAEKAERKRDAYHNALTPNGDTKALMIGEFFEEIEVRNPDYDDESLDEDEDDEPEFITHRVPVSWTTTKAMMERLRSYAHRLAASREAQPATDGGDNG